MIIPFRLHRLQQSLGLNRTVFALSAARMADGIGNSILFIILPLYVATLPRTWLGLPQPVLIGLLISSFGLANAALQPVTAIISDRLGRQRMMIQIGLAAIGLATLGFLFAGSYLHLLGLRIAQGAGLALEIPPTMALLALTTRRETRGGSMGFYTTSRMLGLALGPLLGGWLHDHYGFAAAFYAGAGILLLSIPVVRFGVVQPEAEAPVGGLGFDRSLFTPGLLSAAAATFLMAVGFTLVTTLENEFNARLGIGAFGFSLAFSSLMVGRLVFQVPLGRWSDHRGRRPFILCGLLVMAPVTALLGEAGSLGMFAGLRFAQGIAAAAIVAPALAYAGDVAQQQGEGRRGRQMSIVTIAFMLGVASGPLLAGVLALFAFELPFLATGALCLAGAWMVHRWMEETVDRKSCRQEECPDDNG